MRHKVDLDMLKRMLKEYNRYYKPDKKLTTKEVLNNPVLLGVICADLLNYLGWVVSGGAMQGWVRSASWHQIDSLREEQK